MTRGQWPPRAEQSLGAGTVLFKSLIDPVTSSHAIAHICYITDAHRSSENAAVKRKPKAELMHCFPDNVAARRRRR